MTDHDHLREYLSAEDSRERANRMAEQAKQHIKRKCALIYGDSGSHVEPVTFLPSYCKSCDETISERNRSPVFGQCDRCLQESIALRSMEIATRNRAAEAKMRATFWPAAFWIIVYVPAVCVAAVALAHALNWAAWKLGSMLP